MSQVRWLLRSPKTERQSEQIHQSPTNNTSLPFPSGAVTVPLDRLHIFVMTSPRSLSPSLTFPATEQTPLIPLPSLPLIVVNFLDGAQLPAGGLPQWRRLPLVTPSRQMYICSIYHDKMTPVIRGGRGRTTSHHTGSHVQEVSVLLTWRTSRSCVVTMRFEEWTMKGRVMTVYGRDLFEDMEARLGSWILYWGCAQRTDKTDKY